VWSALLALPEVLLLGVILDTSQFLHETIICVQQFILTYARADVLIPTTAVEISQHRWPLANSRPAACNLASSDLVVSSSSTA
jgi:hypothetical protein